MTAGSGDFDMGWENAKLIPGTAAPTLVLRYYLSTY
jgi:hypothetical protein